MKYVGDLELEEAIDFDGNITIYIDDNLSYINKDSAITVIEHLNEVF